MNSYQAVRERKELHPELFCPVPRCLWRTGGKNGSPCRNHPVASTQPHPASTPPQSVAPRRATGTLTTPTEGVPTPRSATDRESWRSEAHDAYCGCDECEQDVQNLIDVHRSYMDGVI